MSVAVKSQPEHIPSELKAIDRWLVWRRVALSGGGLNKVPIDKGWNTKRQTLEEAMRRAGPGCGVGFYFADDDDIGAVDLDCVRNPDTGEIVCDWARDILAAFGPTYVEVSPSGTGLKVFARGCPVGGKAKANMPGAAMGGHSSPAIEVFGSIGYSTVTGNRLPGTPSSLATAETAKPGWDLIFSRWIKPRHRNDDDDGERVDWAMMDAGALEILLGGLDANRHAAFDDWFSLLCASHRVTGGADDAMEVFVAWSASNNDFAHMSRDVRRRWRTLTQHRRWSGFNAATLIWHLLNEGTDRARYIAGRLMSRLEQLEATADLQWQLSHSDMPESWKS